MHTVHNLGRTVTSADCTNNRPSSSPEGRRGSEFGKYLESDESPTQSYAVKNRVESSFKTPGDTAGNDSFQEDSEGASSLAHGKVNGSSTTHEESAAAELGDNPEAELAQFTMGDPSAQLAQTGTDQHEHLHSQERNGNGESESPEQNAEVTGIGMPGHSGALTADAKNGISRTGQSGGANHMSFALAQSAEIFKMPVSVEQIASTVGQRQGPTIEADSARESQIGSSPHLEAKTDLPGNKFNLPKYLDDSSVYPAKAAQLDNARLAHAQSVLSSPPVQTSSTTVMANAASDQDHRLFIDALNSAVFNSGSGQAGLALDSEASASFLTALSETSLQLGSNRSLDVMIVRSETARLVASQMVEALVRAQKNSVEIVLNPEELGRVRMVLTSTDAGISVSISADRADTLDMLRRNIEQLAEEFRSMGYDDIGFEFSGGDTPSDFDEDAPEPRPNDQSETGTEHDISAPENLTVARVMQMRGLDLRL